MFGLTNSVCRVIKVRGEIVLPRGSVDAKFSGFKGVYRSVLDVMGSYLRDCVFSCNL